ncbi:glycosyltransferase family 4 protein [Salinarimonas ramus]|uniref:Glycosyl transferase family 1 n=1 Tax=Salinarimonas ramus TaxID=690164 RepID=A0A917V5J3_9HYPH|nr:glycosyltransferase family 4 protein [Salinarimonas ramus]GGK40520.1 glycosyl transferase family 1 [Salinarimonas ramus]
MTDRMPSDRHYDVAVALNYYAPYVSGLTETARVVAEELAARGRSVAVVTCRHDPALPAFERLRGVDVYRAPVLATFGRGPISPAFAPLVRRIAKRSATLHLHLPMLDAVAITTGLSHPRIVSTYHIDVWIPPSLTSPLQIAGVNWSARRAIAKSHRVVVNSFDQADHSLLRDVLRAGDLRAIPAPCLDSSGGTPAYRDGPGTHVGFLGRIVPDKGIEFLIPAFLKSARPDDRLLVAGEHQAVAGGGIMPLLRRLANDDPRIRFLGPLDKAQVRDFYASIDVFALTSVAESFGIVQAEAMMCAIPVVTSDIPGGRVPVRETGFGILTEPRDVDAIAHALERLRAMDAPTRAAHAETARRAFGLAACIDRYEDTLFAWNASQVAREASAAPDAGAPPAVSATEAAVDGAR